MVKYCLAFQHMLLLNHNIHKYHELLENSEFYALREHLVGFLEDMHHPQPASPASV